MTQRKVTRVTYAIILVWDATGRQHGKLQWLEVKMSQTRQVKGRLQQTNTISNLNHIKVKWVHQPTTTVYMPIFPVIDG